ncbi:EamA family transporter [Streptomyces sp. TRM43335]|uniref:EamA family transporter n=1 Tax=Streptomyces taklimakanensis TaxID=2569853 RepID=A0A6G2BDD4_9ACTN|nr:DMT family transporter [Streptomyces taklimakanensis]MTE19912.1 EamA family transporter [Streptomyces taklimakanensis]
MNALLSGALVLSWSSGFIGAKLGAESAPAVTLLMWRFLPLTAVLALVVALRARDAWRGLSAGVLGRQAAIGLLSQSAYLFTVYYAIQLGVSSGTTALIDGIQPLVAGALAGPLLRQYVSRRQWIGLWLGVGGAAVVATADASSAAGAAWWAYLVPFLGMLALVAATFLEERSRTRVAPTVSMTVHCATSTVLFTALAVGTGTATPPADPSFWFAVGWLALVATFVAYGLYWLVLERSGVTKVNTLMFLMAPVTAVWGALAFDEPFGPRTVVGLGLGLAAAVIVHRGGTRSARIRTRRARPVRTGEPAEDGDRLPGRCGTGRA